MTQTDEIIEWFKKQIASKQRPPAHVWMDAALTLNVLRFDEEAELNDLHRQVAEKKVEYLNAMAKKNVSQAKLMVEATPLFVKYKNQEAKCAIIEEFVLLAKKASNKDI